MNSKNPKWLGPKTQLFLAFQEEPMVHLIMTSATQAIRIGPSTRTAATVATTTTTKTKQNKIKQNQTKPNKQTKPKQNKTKQNQTHKQKQNKTKQNQTNKQTNETNKQRNNNKITTTTTTTMDHLISTKVLRWDSKPKPGAQEPPGHVSSISFLEKNIHREEGPQACNVSFVGFGFREAGGPKS